MCGKFGCHFFQNGYHDITPTEPGMTSDRTALLIRLPRDLHRRFRVYSAACGIPMSRLVEAAIDSLLRQHTQAEIVGELLRKRAQEETGIKELIRRRAEKEALHE